MNVKHSRPDAWRFTSHYLENGLAIQRPADQKPLRRRRYPTGFPIRCTEREKAEIFARAASVNRSASRFLVELAVRATGPGFASPQSREDLAVLEGLLVQLRRVATNLQELARRDHQFVVHEGAAAPAELDEAVAQARDVLNLVRDRLV